MKALSPELLDEIVRRLVEALDPAEIRLFGSHASGTPDKGSDVDLLVVVDEPEVASSELERRGHMGLWGIRVPVDLIVCTTAELAKWRRVPCNLLHTVAEKGRLIYAAGRGSGPELAAEGR